MTSPALKSRAGEPAPDKILKSTAVSAISAIPSPVKPNVCNPAGVQRLCTLSPPLVPSDDRFRIDDGMTRCGGRGRPTRLIQFLPETRTFRAKAVEDRLAAHAAMIDPRRTVVATVFSKSSPGLSCSSCSVPSSERRCAPDLIYIAIFTGGIQIGVAARRVGRPARCIGVRGRGTNDQQNGDEQRAFHDESSKSSVLPYRRRGRFTGSKRVDYKLDRRKRRRAYSPPLSPSLSPSSETALPKPPSHPRRSRTR